MPAWLGAAGAFKGAEVAFDQGATLADLGQGGGAPVGVPVFLGNGRFHVNKVYYLLYKATKKRGMARFI